MCHDIRTSSGDIIGCFMDNSIAILFGRDEVVQFSCCIKAEFQLLPTQIVHKRRFARCHNSQYKKDFVLVVGLIALLLRDTLAIQALLNLIAGIK
jgi:hypothetical protein